MSDFKDILAAVLSEERSTPERLKSLLELKDFLKEEPAVRQIATAARSEKSVEVRRELLGLLLKVSITQLKDRAAHLDDLLFFASMEPEVDLRLAAVTALVNLAPEDPTVQEILAESLECDLSEAVQAACLDGLIKAPRKTAKIAERVLAFAPTAPAPLRPRLLALIRQLESPSAEAGAVLLLQPDESPELLGEILSFIASLPDLSPPVVKGLGTFLTTETRQDVRAKVISVLRESRTAPAKLFKAVFEILSRLPDGPELLSLFTNRLASRPELVEGLESLFTDTASARLKVAVLQALKDVPKSGLLGPALRDPHPWVRFVAMRLAQDAYASHPKEIGKALLAAIPNEPLADLRIAAARLLAGTGRREPELDKFLVEWIERETDPRIEEALVGAVLGVPITDANRAPVLKAYRKVLTEPFFDEKVKSQVKARLVSFAYRDEPELVECLKALLERTDSIEDVEDLYEHLKKLEPDMKSVSGLLLTLWYRFLQHFPRDPLHNWLRVFKDMAPEVDAVREQIPYIVKLSGATWILEGADTSARKESFLPLFKEKVWEGEYGDAQRLVNDAWQQRTLKKADLAAAFEIGLDSPPEKGLQQSLFHLLAEAKFVSPRIVDLCFDSLRNDPRGMGAYEVKKFLLEYGKGDLGFRAKAITAFNQADYDDFCRTGSAPADIKAPPKTWNDWEYQGWRLTYREWAPAEIFFTVEPAKEIQEILESKPDSNVPVLQSMQYLVLDLIHRETNDHWSEYCKRGPEAFETQLASLAAVLETTRKGKGLELLRDRAVYLYWKRWKDYIDRLKGKPPAKDLAKSAAEVYLELLGLQKNFGPFSEKPLPKLDVEHLQKIWTFGSAPWEELHASHFAVATEEDEQAAKSLFDDAANLVRKGANADAAPILERLLKTYKHTKTVRDKRKNIESALKRK